MDIARILPNPAVPGKTPSFYRPFLINLCTQTSQIPAASIRELGQMFMRVISEPEGEDSHALSLADYQAAVVNNHETLELVDHAVKVSPALLEVDEAIRQDYFNGGSIHALRTKAPDD